MSTPQDGSGLPGVAEVRAYLGNIPATVLPEADLVRLWEAGISTQVDLCIVPLKEDGSPDRPAWPAALVQAALRRVQRHVAAKALPLGYLDTANEFGPARIPNYDAVIAELEAPYRRVVIA